MKTVIRRASARRWAPYQDADILREFAKAIRELDAEETYGNADYDDEEGDYNSDTASNSDGWDSEAESTHSEASSPS